MTSYASIKGRQIRPEEEVSKPSERRVQDLSEAEIERIAINRKLILDHMPEFVEFIKELHAAGLIDGWRAVKKCEIIESSQ